MLVSFQNFNLKFLPQVFKVALISKLNYKSVGIRSSVKATSLGALAQII